MNKYIGCRVLVTTSAWFYAPDGKQYRAIWGTLKSILCTKEDLGFSPNARHTNWVLEIGGAMIAGCQCLYFVLCDNPPRFSEVEHTMYDLQNGAKTVLRPNEIYLSENE